ncbi:MAG TPA: hypothetical protein VIS99_07620, partial [Terrimicrobiaceae bacterium]
MLILEPGFAVLNPNGRDQTKIFAQGAGSPSDDGHAPVNYHGYAACCHGGFFRKVEEVPNAVGGVLILLRRNGIRAAMNAVRELRKRGKQVRISWKESGLPQVGHALANSGLRRKFHALCSAADGFISSTPDLVPLYEAAGCRKGRFVPTPYP